MSFSIDLSNSDQSIKETNKDMNNQKIINPYNPTDHQVKVTKKYVDEKTENWFILFSVKVYAPRNLLIEIFIKVKATYWYHIWKGGENYGNKSKFRCWVKRNEKSLSKLKETIW